MPQRTAYVARVGGGSCHGVSLPTLTALTERIPMIPAGRPSRAGRLALKESVGLRSHRHLRGEVATVALISLSTGGESKTWC